jgi:zinc protease
MKLEADRIARLVLRDPQVSSEKEVVANERGSASRTTSTAP